MTSRVKYHQHHSIMGSHESTVTHGRPSCDGASVFSRCSQRHSTTRKLMTSPTGTREFKESSILECVDVASCRKQIAKRKAIREARLRREMMQNSLEIEILSREIERNKKVWELARRKLMENKESHGPVPYIPPDCEKRSHLTNLMQMQFRSTPSPLA